MRFLVNLLPQLTKAATGTEGPAGVRGNLSSVVSVLDARGNAPLILKDLSLKDNYSLRNAANHAITMTSLSMEELAAAHPSTSFIHAFPGIVKTGLARDYNFVMKAAMTAMLTLASHWTVPLKESGERHLYTATSPVFTPKGTVGGSDAAVGSDGVQGSGAYLVGSDSAIVPDQKILHGYREDGTRGAVWQHTLDVFKNIVGN
jgi:hypothetical protein